MPEKYVFVHLPVAPINYSFSKIGHYHRYVNKKQLHKQKKHFIDQLKKICETELHNSQLKWICSVYTFPLLPFELQKKFYGRLDWSFSHSNKHIPQLQIKVGDRVQNASKWQYFDMETGILARLEENICTIAPNELQAEVSRILNHLRSIRPDDAAFQSQLKWFLNAEHILWMDKNTEKHLYTSPFNSPYDAYINFMNMLSDLKLQYQLNF